MKGFDRDDAIDRLAKFAWHDSFCPAHYRGVMEPSCTCGLATLMAQIQAARRAMTYRSAHDREQRYFAADREQANGGECGQS